MVCTAARCSASRVAKKPAKAGSNGPWLLLHLAMMASLGCGSGRPDEPAAGPAGAAVVRDAGHVR